MALVNNKLTTAGKKILADSISSGQQNYIQFTKISVGDGTTTQDWATLSDLVHIVKNLPIQGVNISGEKNVTVRGVFTNTDLTAVFFFRELGLYAIDKSTGNEVLFSYGNAGENAEEIPLSTAKIVERILDLVVTVSNTSSVSLSIPSGTYATKDDIENVSVQVAGFASELATKANQAYVEGKFGSMAGMFTFKGSDTYANILALVDMVTNDCWYDTTNSRYVAYNGTSWATDLGNINIGDKSVAPKNTSFIEVVNLFNKNDVTVGRINHALYGWMDNASYQDSGFIEVDYNTQYIIELLEPNNAYVNYWTASKSGISSLSGSSVFTNGLMTVPDNQNIAYVSFAIRTTEDITTIMFVKGNALPSSYIQHKYTFTSDMDGIVQEKDLSPKCVTADKLADGIVFESRIKDKVFNVLGDSLSSVDYTLPNWWQILATRAGASFNNYAVSGTPIKSNGSTGFVDRYSAMSDSADGVIVMGSTNDGATQLGTWDSIDATTFYGALNTLMQGLINKFTGKPIIFITPTPLWFNPSLYSKNPIVDLLSKSATDTVTLQLRVEAIIAKCKQYGLHLIDVYNNSGINYYDTNHVYYIEDQTHESALGHERLANFIGADLETMF